VPVVMAWPPGGCSVSYADVSELEVRFEGVSKPVKLAETGGLRCAICFTAVLYYNGSKVFYRHDRSALFCAFTFNIPTMFAISGISTVKLETYGADATSSTRRRSRMRTEKESRVTHVEAALWETPANTDNLLSINEMMLWALSIGVGSNIDVSSSLCSRHRKPTSIHHTTRRSHTECGKF
jgi:hypothetical protein